MLLPLTEEAGRQKKAEELANKTELSYFDTVSTVNSKCSVIQDTNYPNPKMRNEIKTIPSSDRGLTLKIRKN